MISSLLLVAILKPRVVLKSSRDPVTRTYFRFPTNYTVAVFVDGRDTGIRTPDWREDPKWAIGFEAVREFSNDRRDLGGEFNEIYRGAMNGEYHHLFLKLKGDRFRMLPRTPGNNNARTHGIDERGRLLAVDDPPLTGLSKVMHAYLWNASEWTDIGPALEAHIGTHGAILGMFHCDREGRPTAAVEYDSGGYSVRFRWKDGKRTESKPYQA